ncbi:hypothetical protein LSH36_480g01048 [Paralvinella palmiformis]|uniref:FAD dependent oxidoreductase domain-containing protein n=1 Tax=Paralvinella palmiformis TaxID=53620 RepID=A0AAD9J992_9ANNE|nr:hypothetical protein LSH36_480g01048 [Paralvinella palmiformis]
MKVVICGGGIIGASIAYHLALKGVKSTIIERCALACAASGKAGGFLARDWCDHFEVGPLARKSFDMHMTFAKDERFQHCGYRVMDAIGVTVKEGNETKCKNLPIWLNGSVIETSTLGDKTTTAQVYPDKLTHAFFNIAKDLVNTELKIANVQGIETTGSKVTGVKTSTGVVTADVIIIAMGPWSGEAMKWFNLPPVTGHRAHNVILKPSHTISAHACFVEFTGKTGSRHSPEVYPRPDGTVYLCGMSDEEELPSNPEEVSYNPESCTILKQMIANMSSSLRDATVVTERGCYLPIPPASLPVIGSLPGTGGLYLATGHSCWGILNAPATGEAIAQLIVNGECSVCDISPFSPARLTK